MQTISRSNFTTVTTEGAILPADLLQRIVDGRELDGLAPTDYHLAPNERLNEAINRSWNRLLGVWDNFDERRQTLPEHDRGTTLTRESWLLILLEELGFGRPTYVRSLPLTHHESRITPDGDDVPSYPISHEWQHVPLHLITFRQSLDRVDEDRGERFRRSPHSLAQEFLNRSEQHLWGLVSNGLRLRLLRDNVSFTRAAYLEFDLEAMMDGEIYSDFTLLWLVAHQSRVEGDPQSCWLETWSQEAAEQGTRALDSLRDGVQNAISELGRGFLAHPANKDLRAKLQAGDGLEKGLDKQDYYRQLLRLVYRLIFLFVAEERDLLLVQGTEAATRQRYYEHYSVTHLRALAERRRSGPHPDLYRSLRLVMELLREGYEPLGLPGLGSFLFSARSTPDLDEAEMANEALLNAIRALTFTVQDGVRRPVDYKNLGAEELGSVYESLLELHPEMNVQAATFNLRTAAGSERKTTGSYYTPTSLINSLLDTALEPVIEDRLREARKEESAKRPQVAIGAPSAQSASHLQSALLSIKVVDPACGSGHFLIAAANRLARHLARIRTGDEEPSPEANRLALRDVVRHCIHGVDANEMAVELCKVGLWLETLDPGKPLSFLEKNILHGNSLVGVGPGMEITEIPYEAFEPVTGDHRPTVMDLRARNRREQGNAEEEIAGQFGLRWEVTVIETMEDLERWREKRLAHLNAMPENEVSQLREKQEAYHTYLESDEYQRTKLEYDLWTSAFFWSIPEDDADTMLAPTHQELITFQAGQPLDAELRRRVEKMADERDFFHWELAFSDVFSGDDPGFDVVLGNPPWERVKLQEKEWFSSRSPEIADAPRASIRRKMIKALRKDDPALYDAFVEDKRAAENESLFTRNSTRYPLCGRGDINTYALFAELAHSAHCRGGRAGIIVPTGIATDLTYQYFFQDLMETRSLVKLIGFENEEFIFPAVANVVRFCTLTLSGPESQHPNPYFAFFIRRIDQLGEEDRYFELAWDDLKLLNPNSLNCPIFRSTKDAELTKAIYRRIPVLIEEGPQGINPWGVEFIRMFDMASDSSSFHTKEELDINKSNDTGNTFARNGHQYVPLYEGKLFWHFDHRFASYDVKGPGKGGRGLPEMPLENHQSPYYSVMPRYWVLQSSVEGRLADYSQRRWLIAFRDITSSKLERTVVCSPLPQVAVGHSAPVILPSPELPATVLACYLANMNAIVFDYIARQKLGGTHLTYFVLKQLPLLAPKQYTNADIAFIFPRVLELSYTAYDIRGLAQDAGYRGPPFQWDEERRAFTRAELDAYFALLYGLNREELRFILDPEDVHGTDYPSETFRVLKERELKEYGEYRTKRLILEIYEEMAVARETDTPYQTRLDPPPAHPDAAHPWDEEYLGPELPGEEWWEDEMRKGVMRKDVVREPGVSYRADDGGESPAARLEIPQDVAFAPPEGSRSKRLRAVMDLGKKEAEANVRQLVGALADEDESVRWLAGSTLVKFGGQRVVRYLAAFLEQGPNSEAHEQAQRVLGMLADAAEDAEVREMARATLVDTKQNE